MTAPDEPAFPSREGGLVRLRLDLEYDGTGFAGWASQPGLRTVQQVLEAALSTLFRVPRVAVVVAGRTDTGVHATGQVCHCDVAAAGWAEQRGRIVRRLAGLLPPDVRVRAVTEALADFDARFSALWRRYRYRICDAEYGAPVLRRVDTVGWKRTLDAAAMDRAGQRLLGLHDYAAFCRRRPGATTVRRLEQLAVRRRGELVEIEVQADAFCHSMVRSLVGALAAVGEGSRDEEWPYRLLGLGERSDHITVAPARGLTLVAVGYPAEAELAARAAQTRGLRSLDAGRPG
ncbi:tRNA pseudouridine(38-40) synthase TruA [Jatrophihabitans sp.]|uniref:tRNA pseudouridine(38-40) synthase TruA n=1 Tax=Jatrophihabitans sp. TaxID=1932789 RepID=UPI002C32B00B|nr:tRNA pseudouridine(38-40) synthase TruA [Jatrophihabitans sp.]